MKKKKFAVLSCMFIIIALLTLASCTQNEVQKASNTVANENYDTDYRPNSLSPTPISSETDSLLNHSEVINVVIFIYFSNENEQNFLNSLDEDFISQFNGEERSLYDYYRTLSYGKFSVRSIMPYQKTNPEEGKKFFVYKAPNPRSYYLNVDAETGTARYDPESRLLNAAVKAADNYFDYNGYDLDVNNDGLVDSVSFVVNGTYNNPADWGELMWPHAWNLNRISLISSDKCPSETLNGINVGNYTFTFATNFSLGLVTHEFGHLLGLPDLYHYTYDTQYLPVGYWDIMHYECKTPQFTLTHLRQKYLDFIDKSQVRELTTGGMYSLTPTASASKNDVLAYKVTISAKESIWIEYRTADQNTYDAELPGSGLIVYRVNNTVVGNTEGRYHNYRQPDEVFIFRPDCAPSLLTYVEKEKYNLSKAAVGLNNPQFLKLGNSSVTTLYDPNCIYTSSGANTGIVINVTAQTEDQIIFSIDLGEYDCNDISESYITGKTLEGTNVKNTHHMYYGEQPDIQVFLKYKNRTSPVEITEFDIEYDTRPSSEGQIAYAVFNDGKEERKLPFTLHIYDRALADATLIRPPRKTIYTVGDEFDFSGIAISVNYTSGNDVKVEYSEENASKWSISEGLDMRKRGVYDNVVVIYNGEIRITLSGITVNSSLVRIEVSEMNTRHIKNRSLSPKYNVIGIFEDNTKASLPQSAYTVSEPSGTDEYKTVKITSNENSSAYCMTYFYDMADGLPVEYEIFGPKSFKLIFGEEPNFKDSTLTVRFTNGLSAENLPLENYHSEFCQGIELNKVGPQKVSAAIGSLVINIEVAVSAKNNSILTIEKQDHIASNIIINNDTNSIVLTDDFTLAEFSEYISSYLQISFFDRNGNYEIQTTTHANRAMGYGVGMNLLTKSGKVAVSYSIYRLGDADGNGTIDNSDKLEWILSLLSVNTTGTYRKEFDANFDSKYTLTDFVILNETEGLL